MNKYGESATEAAKLLITKSVKKPELALDKGNR